MKFQTKFHIASAYAHRFEKLIYAISDCKTEVKKAASSWRIDEPTNHNRIGSETLSGSGGAAAPLGACNNHVATSPQPSLEFLLIN